MHHDHWNWRTVRGAICCEGRCKGHDVEKSAMRTFKRGSG